MATERLRKFISEELSSLPADHSDRAFFKNIDWLTERYINKPKENQLNCLTPRQKEVLGLIAQGFSNKTIVDKCVLGQHSVVNYANAIYLKTGISSMDSTVNKRVQCFLLYQRNTPEFKNPVEEYCSISPLTPRQKEVVRLIGEGYSNQGVGYMLKISEKAVERRIARIQNTIIIVDKQTYSYRVVLALFAQTRHITQ